MKKFFLYLFVLNFIIYGYSDKKNTNVKVIKKTTTLNSIKEMQSLLKSSGYYTGSIDGIAGNSTKKAVKLYLNDETFNNKKLDQVLKKNGFIL